MRARDNIKALKYLRCAVEAITDAVHSHSYSLGVMHRGDAQLDRAAGEV